VKGQVLAGLLSDHKLIRVECIESDEEKIKGYRGFKFESKWMLDEECNEVIKEAWRETELVTNPVEVMRSKLDRC
jgi:hypothetical protein